MRADSTRPTRPPISAWVIALLALVAGAYANALPASFQFDDFQMVVANPRVHGLAAWWAALPGIRPLLKLSYALNWMLSGAPWTWHAFDLGVHALNALLVFVLARRWQRDLRLDEPPTPWLPFAVAALFALHPATTEAVTYVSGRSTSLMALFYLAAFVAHRRAEDGSHDTRWRALACVLFALALAVRETAVTLPLALLLYALLRGQPLRTALGSLRDQAAVLGAGAIAMVLTPGYRSFFGWSLITRDLPAQLHGQLQAHAYLALHTALGLRTNIDPDIRIAAGMDAASVATAMAGLALLAVAWRNRVRRPWLSFGLLWYGLQLAPSNSLLPRFDLANDRHLYLALPGLALVAAGVLRALRPPALGLALLVALLALMTVRTHQRNAEYRSELTLWQATVRDSPGKARPWLNLGFARQTAGDRAGAIRAYRCSLRRDPGYGQAAINLGALDAPARDPAGAADPCLDPDPPPR